MTQLRSHVYFMFKLMVERCRRLFTIYVWLDNNCVYIKNVLTISTALLCTLAIPSLQFIVFAKCECTNNSDRRRLI